jgi:hypothetical protein
MEHFPEHIWIDFVRGIPANKTGRSEKTVARAELHAHLASGCKDCLETFGFWKELDRVAARESGHCPPENAVRLAKVEFAARRLRGRADAVEARLVFDTFKQPLPAGVRSAAATPRQMVYEAGGLTVDLRFDVQPRAKKVHLIGQVLGADRLGTVRGIFPVMVCTEKDLLLAESTTNNLGEFYVEFAAQDHLRLCFWVTSKKLIRIGLENLQTKTDWDGTRADPTSVTRDGLQA